MKSIKIKALAISQIVCFFSNSNIMNLTQMTVFLLFTFSNYAQKVPLVFYLNNTEYKNHEIEMIAITKTDTIKLETRNSIINFSELRDNFSLHARIQNDTIQVGAFRPKDISKLSEIFVGRITDFKTVDKFTDYDNTFIFRNLYAITISNWKEADDVIFGMIIHKMTVNTNGKSTMSYSSQSKIVKLKE